jgi:tRNA-Thr(GGU) m(6)t(6)A37 methyltransferase TsaA
MVTGVGGRQVLVEDPSGNPVELFEPTRAEARLEPGGGFEIRPIGHVRSGLTDVADAPNQGDRGAPDAWLVISPEVREGIRDIAVGADLLVLTWLHLSRRDELSTVPGDDPGGPERGVFSTRSSARPNPIGLHRVTVLETEPGRLRVHPLEAVDGTPLVDIKPVIRAAER